MPSDYVDIESETESSERNSSSHKNLSCKSERQHIFGLVQKLNIINSKPGYHGQLGDSFEMENRIQSLTTAYLKRCVWKGPLENILTKYENARKFL